MFSCFEMMTQVSIANQGDALRRFWDNMVQDVDVDSHGHATIHSGHFMVSCVHEDAEDADSSSQPSVKEEAEARQEGYNFENANREPTDSYKFGARSTNQLSIDASLATLFEHMTLAYSGKITSPKWKNFKGIKVKLKDKIRLNNIIWREWHMQYIKRQKPIICQFEAPISERTHSKPEAVVLEGKYWKRRLECLTTEYKKWRLFFKDRFSRVRKDCGLMEEVELSSELGKYDRFGKGGVCRTALPLFSPNRLLDEQMTVDDDYFSGFSDDTLFSSLNQPFAFPDPREISQLGFGDIIQPHLLQLQPSLDESMDTLPPLPIYGDFREFGRATNERNMSRKMGDAGLLDLFLNEPGFPYDPVAQQQSSQQGTSLSEQQQQSTTAANDAYLIDQLKQQLMGDSAAASSLSDLFSSDVVDNKYLTQVPSATSTATRTSQRDSFFSSDVRGGRVDSQRAPQQQQTSDQSFQLPLSASQVMQLNNLLAENRSLGENHGGFAQNASTGQQVFTGSTHNSLFQVLPLGSQVTVMQGPSSSSQEQPWLQQSPTPSASSTGYSPSSEPTRKTSQQHQQQQQQTQQQQHGNYAIVCLPNEVHPNNCRRGSTGSLQHGKGKKHVTFLCPQPLPAQSTSKTKPRALAPAPAVCDTGIKTTGGLLEMSRAKSVPSLDREQQGGILAQLLTQGKPRSFFKPVRGGAVEGGGGGDMSSSATPTKKLPPSSTITSQSSYFLGQSSCSQPSNSQANQPMPSQMRRPPSVNDFHKKLLSAAVSQTFGVEKMAAQEVTTSLLNNMFDVAFNSSSASTALPSTSTTSDMDRSRNPSNESNASQTDEGQQSTEHPRGENRKYLHLSAEQKRRSNIKYGFETLNQMVPELSTMSSGKINKATTLQRAAECCRRMKQDRLAVKQQMDALHREIDELQEQISSCQSQLPATGVPVVRPQTNRSKVLFEEYVRSRTLANWKFWIFSFLIRPLFEVYDENVVTTSAEVFCQSVLTWLQQQCSLVSLRPAVLKALRELSTSTSILVDPSSMPQQATEAVSRSRNSSGHSSSFT